LSGKDNAVLYFTNRYKDLPFERFKSAYISNRVLYFTNRYKDLPLVVKGAGAGAEVTAAGILADIIRAVKV
jgi:homoserine dehydrogenase